MRKIVLFALALLLFCTVASAEESKAELPGECMALIEGGHFDGYRCTSWCQPSKDYIAAILHKDKRNVLILFKATQKDGWKIALTTEKAVPQGPNDAYAWDFTGGYSMSNVQYGTAFGVNYAPDDGEAWNQVCIWTLRNGNWHVASYHTDQPDFVTFYIYGDKLVFLDDGWSDESTTTVYGYVQTDLRYFSLAALPKSVKEAREKLSSPPKLPVSSKLIPQDVKLPSGKKYAVYSGPGKEYLRAAENKAVVSTNDWVQVFGEENGWILIQYDITSSKMRFGYIEASALPKNIKIEPLSLDVKSAVIIEETFLTDDPLKSGEGILILPRETPVQWLAALGEEYAYVEAAVANQPPVRGFVPADALGQTAEDNANEASGRLEGLYGKYQFKKQVYMNPLSSFLALEGFHEYYTFSESGFVITDQSGNQRNMQVSYQPGPVDEASFRDSFMMDGFGVPDMAAYREKSRYTITDTSGNASYRLYLLDDEIWLAQIHQDSANAIKNEYIWSIYQIERFDGEIPLTVSISGTQDGVKKFLALPADSRSGYDPDTCYNITPDGFGENSGYSVFKYDASCASFLLFENKIYPLGEWFGGFGVTSMALADLNEDGRQELYFTYSFGSGLHRAHAAYFDPELKRVVPIEYTHFNKDMLVAASETGGLALYDAVFSSMDSFVQYEMKNAGHIADIVYEGGQMCLSPVPQE